jgi:DNA repair protein RadC
LLVAHVDRAARCIHVEHYEGEAAAVSMPVRRIVADAAKLGSAGIVVAHNHPSGDSRPSDADCRATRRLARAGEAIDLAILDHLIFAGRDCSSMRRMGLL